jgi:hypothetical protein
MWRRLPTTIALAGLLTVAVLYVALWSMAFSRGKVRAIAQHYDAPPEFRGNHGPWRHDRVLRRLSSYASVVMVVGVLPLAATGAVVEGTRRSGIVVGLALVMLVVGYAHFPLFD